MHSGSTVVRGLRFLAPVLAILFVLGACADGADTSDVAVDQEPDVADQEPDTAHAAAPHFSYEGDTGPEFWGDLSDDWVDCRDGSEQSPVDLPAADGVTDAASSGLTFSYAPSDLRIRNNGHTVQVTYDAGSSLEVDGTTYELRQFHFHARSEHTIDGQDAPLEVHFVHSAPNNRFAVVGVLIKEGQANEAYADVMANLPAEETAEAITVDDVTIDAAAMLPEELTAFSYDGSFTTPPCTQGVRWNVLVGDIEMSAEQIAAFTAIYDNNTRPRLPLGDRPVQVSGA